MEANTIGYRATTHPCAQHDDLSQNEGVQQSRCGDDCVRTNGVATRMGFLQQGAHAEAYIHSIRYYISISACAKGSEWQLAMGFVSRGAYAQVTKSIPVTISSISTCKHGQEWQLALGVLSSMEHAQVTKCLSVAVFLSVPAKMDKSGNSHWGLSAVWNLPKYRDA